MCQQGPKDWITDIVEKTVENYNGREIVIWGKYEVGDKIKEELWKRYGIETAFYVDGDATKIDNEDVFSPDCLCGKSDNYYVVIPLAFYEGIKEKLTGGGYTQHKDYYYFCDCALRQEEDYYEDAHGNKIIGKYQGLKFAFTGFHAVIKIGAGVRIECTSLYVHSGAKVVMEEGAQVRESMLNMDPFAEVSFGKEAGISEIDAVIETQAALKVGAGERIAQSNLYLRSGSKLNAEQDVIVEKSSIDIAPLGTALLGKGTIVSDAEMEIGNSAALTMRQECSISHAHIRMGKKAEVFLEERIFISRLFHYDGKETTWNIRDGAKLDVGGGGRFRTGIFWLDDNSILKIGTGFSIDENHRIVVNKNSSIFIGDDCMFSYDIRMRSNDGHSIFEIETGRKINSSREGDTARKIVIGNHVWIGERCEILYNTKIGDGSIIGAMSLVKSIIPNNCIAAGVPAKVRRKNIAWSRKEDAEDIIECGRENINYTE